MLPLLLNCLAVNDRGFGRGSRGVRVLDLDPIEDTHRQAVAVNCGDCILCPDKAGHDAIFSVWTLSGDPITWAAPKMPAIAARATMFAQHRAAYTVTISAASRPKTA
ncbi:MAG: hypothetical protein HZT43_10800 [Exiguobacterium profundum]|nr:MAG: hypothetical protein HZT43_10800 [Exiguobacterium profundum]